MTAEAAEDPAVVSLYLSAKLNSSLQKFYFASLAADIAVIADDRAAVAAFNNCFKLH